MSAPDAAEPHAGLPAPEQRLAEALKAHSGTITAASQAGDPLLDQRVLGEARRISAQISASRAGTALSARPPVAAPGIPWWLWLSWLVAIAAVATIGWLALR